jgi:hypothetical protein
MLVSWLLPYNHRAAAKGRYAAYQSLRLEVTDIPDAKRAIAIPAPKKVSLSRCFHLSVWNWFNRISCTACFM